ncbi:glycosyltransferase [Dysgonomonas sp. 25]|uniref:glycosyltransferase n=1 Tax=Dysgonomonas sp. 25 TaxID=2302933 RepID=UPI0013D1A7D7|nr:glycosyltransferase [Dysgonomonas sp. 25]NDV68379.1 glycosyltransferase [Dysgonomonas sp. 25]
MQIPVSFYTIDIVEIIGLSLLLLLFVIQLYFYLVYYRKPLNEAKKTGDTTLPYNRFPKVSVVMESENEYLNLKELLPQILEQDYPDFEVIVVNNGSTDESYELLESLKVTYPNLYHTFLPHSLDKKYGFRKMALTLGIKAAKGDVVLVTEPFCRPLSNRWIASMIEQMSDEKEIVLGHAFYAKDAPFYNRIARFDDMFFSLQYLSAAIKGKPYTGVYPNIAFARHLFFDNKGFSGHLYLENSEDVFINTIANASNTAVCLNTDGFMEKTLNSFAHWRKIKKSYSMAKACFKSGLVDWFSFEAFSRYLFYGLFIALGAYASLQQDWGVLIVTGLFFLIRYIVQLVVLNKSSRYFLTGTFRLSLLILDWFQPLYTLRFRSRSRRVR